MQTDDLIGITLVIACVAVSLPLALTHASFKAQEMSETWRKLAHRHRLHFEPGRRGQKPFASGTLRGHALRMGKVRATEPGPYFMELSLRSKPPAELHLQPLPGSPAELAGPEGALGLLERIPATGAEARLESVAKIEPQDSDEVLRYLTKTRRAAALRLATLGGQLEGGKLKVIITDRSARELEALDAVLHELESLAPVLEEA
jgi:hypothetical protein